MKMKVASRTRAMASSSAFTAPPNQAAILSRPFFSPHPITSRPSPHPATPLRPKISSSLSASRTLPPPSPSTTRVVCVGDMHDAWSATDESALSALAPHIILFVGDYGNENVPIVQRIASYAKASPASTFAVLGNHDGFYSMSQRGRDNCPYDARKFNRVREQLDLLVAINPSYKCMTSGGGAPANFSVVGGRPLTWGGPHWKHAPFYRQYFEMTGMLQSGAKIAEAATGAEEGDVIFLAHNGPTGLGDRPEDPCGRDFGSEPGGDFGDPDLRVGIVEAKKAGKRVPLVVFGHMHSRLQRGGERIMMKVEEETVMLDAAVVPRHRVGPEGMGVVCQFSVVEIGKFGVDFVEQIWVKGSGEIVEGKVLLDRRDAKENEGVSNVHEVERAGATAKL